ncbi:SDR family NAD(P)-dependent oxidoreductase [Alicyclobacillus ferrooxydans]|uniref:Short-chain dehydrogenase n=1 Tax=Alicyclobacillus ferrooxydans TaxID=471514 RepID=A0A0P9EL95_9BACL|nr:glucose 1-dehydrogenase [Alicyclobacillus ferrooxydans]KPV44009.1 short-chain dehydrogenase [Alicyclobacillus ferrooxydans]
MGRLQDKVAIITGAGTGIGKQTALLFAAEGASVVVTDIHEESGSQTANEIVENGGDALFFKHDVRSESDWQQVVQTTVEKYQKIDVLFNNAGIYLIKPLTETTVEEWERLMGINVTGVFLGMKHVLPVMAKQRAGSVINASSVAGLIGAAGHALYGASKGAVRIMTKDVAAEYAPYQIRVNSIHPGYIRTGMAEYGAQMAQVTMEQLGQGYPLGRLGDPMDVAKLVLFLASDDSSYITATEFVIDGGMTSIPS